MVVAIVLVGCVAGLAISATALLLALPLWAALLAFMAGGSVAALLCAIVLASRTDGAPVMTAAEPG